MSKRVQAFSITETMDYYLSKVPEAPRAGRQDTLENPINPDQFTIFTSEGWTQLDGPLQREDRLKAAPPIKSDHFALVLCLQGTYIKTVGQFSFRMEPGSLHLVSPKYMHSFGQASDDLRVYSILFKKEFLSDTYIKEPVLDDLLERDNDRPPVYRLGVEDFHTVKSLFDCIYKEYSEAHSYHIPVIKLSLIRLLYEVTRADEREQHGPTRHLTHQSQLVRQYKKTVESSFIDKRTVQEYADMLNISAKHLSELVRNETGQTALSIIHQRLFLEAQYLLGYSTLSIKEIADQLNFTSNSHFTRFFKHMAGYSPSVLKKEVYNLPAAI
jgi:AraC family transcriptional activator of pobA